MPSRDTGLPVSIDDITAAAERLAGQAVRTPLLSNQQLDERVRGRILFKPEIFQHTGSFKFRGAYSKLSAVSAEERARGVVAWSSGNHAQGVAMAARRLSTKALIVMPSDAPEPKMAATRALGAEIRPYDRWTEDREAISHAIAAERGSLTIPPYDDPLVIAGQGTIGLELADDAAARREALDDVLVACSGGGLLAGISTALAARSPSTKVWSVEPEGHDDLARSLKADVRVSNEPGSRSICDALLAPTPGEITFAINRVRLAGGLVVNDEEVLDAIAYAARVLKLVLEPAGAITLAAVLTGKVPTEGRTIAIVLSGGNIEPALLVQAMTRG